MELINYLNIAMLLIAIISLIFLLMNNYFLATYFGLLSFVIGICWCCFVPFPISLIGGLVAIGGGIAVGKSN